MSKNLDEMIPRNDRGAKKARKPAQDKAGEPILAQPQPEDHGDAREAPDGRIKPEPGIQFVWFDQARRQVPETLYGFITGLLVGYEHTEQSLGWVAAAAGMAAINAVASRGQGSHPAMLWSLIGELMNNRAGIYVITDYLTMLNPHTKPHFTTVPKAVFKIMIEQAKHLVSEAEAGKIQPEPEVLEHWRKISNLVIPFGYRLGE